MYRNNFVHNCSGSEHTVTFLNEIFDKGRATKVKVSADKASSMMKTVHHRGVRRFRAQQCLTPTQGGMRCFALT